MLKLKFLLNLSFFLIIILSSSCISKSRDSNYCIFDIDCEASERCVEKKCTAYNICINTSDCNQGQNCIENQCKTRICLSDAECGEDEYCDNAECIYIPKKDIGGDCIDYGNIECESYNCIADQYRLFCTIDCEINEDCPNDMICDNFFQDRKSCLYRDSNDGDYRGTLGSDCSLHGQSDCLEAYTCVENINDKDMDKCLMTCEEDYNCYTGYKCLKHEDNNYYCIPPNDKKTGEICNRFGELECKNNDDNCIKVTDNFEKFCTKTCETDNDCSDQTICKPFGIKKYCMNDATSDLGESCKDGGTQQCKDELICDITYSRGAICTKECQNDIECSDYSSCTITYNQDKLCRPAANGLGDRTGELGNSCIEHGDSDCKDNLLCLSASLNDQDSFCTSHCNNDEECGEEFHCADPSKTGNKLCVKGVRGELGSSCYNDSCNDELFCNINQYNDYTATCTRLCDTVGEECEKSGFYCNQIYDTTNYCLEKQPISLGNLGDKCTNNNCKEGLNCIFDMTGNFCSRPCNTENLCPEEFSCEVYDENNNFCYSTL